MTSGTLEDLVSAIYPHLKGKAVIDGDPFDCPLPIHLDGDTRKMRLVSGKKSLNEPPWSHWKCAAGCRLTLPGGKNDDTLDFITSALGVEKAKAVAIHSKLSKAPVEKMTKSAERLLGLIQSRSASPEFPVPGGNNNDALDFIRLSLGVDCAKAFFLWAKIAKEPPERWREIIASNFPHFFEGIAA